MQKNFTLDKMQTEYLKDMFEEIEDMNKNKKPGMIIAQIIMADDGLAFVRAGIVKNEISSQIQDIMGGEKGTIIDSYYHVECFE